MSRLKQALKAPFPYFGGKKSVAEQIWKRLGEVENYIEPFFGSGAVLLSRPGLVNGVETVNDKDHYLANFWRATQADPDAVAHHANWPVSEVDLHSRHRWLVFSDDAVAFRAKMVEDPTYYDARIAGWWCWGLCCWIGGKWCEVPESDDPSNPPKRRVRIGRGGVCVQARPQLADRHSPGRGVHANGELGTDAERLTWLRQWFGELRDRLRLVRVCCGDWRRVCSSASTTTRLGITGVFLDPPYGENSGRNMNLYAQEDGAVAEQVRRWCNEHGRNRQMRIVLAGLAGEGHEVLEDSGWRVTAWTGNGYGNRTKAGRDRASRERLWFSPHCVFERELFDECPSEDG